MGKVDLQKNRHLLSILCIAIVSIAIYANSLKNGFVYDDKDTIVNNSFIKDFHNLPGLFKKKDYFALSGEVSYRPIVTLTYFMEYSLFKLDPWGYHLTNILLHAVNGILLYIFIMLLAKEPKMKGWNSEIWPLVTTLLFAMHPILTEAVNAVSYREDLLVFLFYIATMNLYLTLKSALTSKSLSLYLLSCTTCILALLSKEMAVTLPLIIYCYEFIYHYKRKGSGTTLFNTYNIGYIGITAIYIYLRFYYFHNPMEKDLLGWGLTARLFTVPWLVINYLKLAIFPVSLSADYFVMPVKSLYSPFFLLPSITIISILITAFLVGKEKKGIAFGVIFFVVTLMPVYNLFPLTNPLAERYLYLPLAGFCMAIGSNLYFLYDASALRLKSQKLYLISFLAIMTIYSSGIINRNEIWKDDYSLWSDVGRKIPVSNRPYYNDIGNILYEQGRFEEAIKQYQTALRVRPNFVEAYNNLGNVYAELGKLGDAIEHYKTALRLAPNLSEVHLNLGSAYERQGRFGEAIEEFKAAVKIKPNESRYHYILGTAYDKRGRLDEAVQEFKAVTELSPGDVNAHYYLGTIYLKKKIKDKARVEFEMILKLKPDFFPASQVLESLNREKLREER